MSLRIFSSILQTNPYQRFIFSSSPPQVWLLYISRGYLWCSFLLFRLIVFVRNLIVIWNTVGRGRELWVPPLPWFISHSWSFAFFDNLTHLLWTLCRSPNNFDRYRSSNVMNCVKSFSLSFLETLPDLYPF